MPDTHQLWFALLSPLERGPDPSQCLEFEAEANRTFLQKVLLCHRTWISWSDTVYMTPRVSRVIPQEHLGLQPQCLGCSPKTQPVAP